MLALLSRNEGDIVVFHIWKTLRYKYRILLSLILILAGLIIQFMTMNHLPGLIIIILGNLLLLTKGYTNKVDLGGYEPDAEWQKANPQHLDEIQRLNKKMKSWNLSLFDISNAGGLSILLLIVLGVFAIGITAYYIQSKSLGILALDAFVLLVPHWYTGVKKIMTTPKVVQKIEIFKELINLDYENKYDIKYLVLLAGSDTRVPKDLKLKISFKHKPEGFLGLYGQISINQVQGKDYPYFYMVLVAKSDLELKKNCKEYKKMGEFILDFETRENIQTVVLRQHTTKSSGYFTDSNTRARILKDGLVLTEKLFHIFPSN